MHRDGFIKCVELGHMDYGNRKGFAKVGVIWIKSSEIVTVDIRTDREIHDNWEDDKFVFGDVIRLLLANGESLNVLYNESFSEFVLNDEQ